MFRIRIADLVIGIDNQYEYVEQLCESYRVDDRNADFFVSVSEELSEEKKASDWRYSSSYCESICLYRRICLELIR